MKNFAILGVGGYIAPRHLQAIKDTGNKIVCAHDPFDSVGILDRYSQDIAYFKDFEKFESFIESNQIDYFSICTPNYLHFDHIRCALRNNCHAICEKPLVLTLKEIEYLQNLEQKTGKKVFNILQLRTHPSLIKLKEKIDTTPLKEKYQIDLTYITSRGPWYFETWKEDQRKSGGLATNIGIHFFDMLTWIFGGVEQNEVYEKTDKTNSGYLELEKAQVNWKLSIDKNQLPKKAQEKNMTTFRSIRINGEEIEFSDGFTDLHTEVYKQILSHGAFGLELAKKSIIIAEEIRNTTPSRPNFFNKRDNLNELF
jgi:UDP-N-acetyl-2-amino-2-deoxyglucuronate dehydrogenase